MSFKIVSLFGQITPMTMKTPISINAWGVI